VNEKLFVDVPIRVLHGWTSFHRSGKVPCFHTRAESNRESRSWARLSSCGTHLTRLAKYLVLRKSFHIVLISRWHSIGLLFDASQTVWVSSKIPVIVTDVSFERVSKSFCWIFWRLSVYLLEVSVLITVTIRMSEESNCRIICDWRKHWVKVWFSFLAFCLRSNFEEDRQHSFNSYISMPIEVSKRKIFWKVDIRLIASSGPVSMSFLDPDWKLCLYSEIERTVSTSRGSTHRSSPVPGTQPGCSTLVPTTAEKNDKNWRQLFWIQSEALKEILSQVMSVCDDTK
jgi:hypothetical protein